MYSPKDKKSSLPFSTIDSDDGKRDKEAYKYRDPDIIKVFYISIGVALWVSVTCIYRWPADAEPLTTTDALGFGLLVWLVVFVFCFGAFFSVAVLWNAAYATWMQRRQRA